MGVGLCPPAEAAPLDPACYWIEDPSRNRLALKGTSAKIPTIFFEENVRNSFEKPSIEFIAGMPLTLICSNYDPQFKSMRDPGVQPRRRLREGDEAYRKKKSFLSQHFRKVFFSKYCLTFLISFSYFLICRSLTRKYPHPK